VYTNNSAAREVTADLVHRQGKYQHVRSTEDGRDKEMGPLSMMKDGRASG
jgi:hypothetical protein